MKSQFLFKVNVLTNGIIVCAKEQDYYFPQGDKWGSELKAKEKFIEFIMSEVRRDLEKSVLVQISTVYTEED